MTDRQSRSPSKSPNLPRSTSFTGARLHFNYTGKEQKIRSRAVPSTTYTATTSTVPAASDSPKRIDYSHYDPKIRSKTESSVLDYNYSSRVPRESYLYQPRDTVRRSSPSPSRRATQPVNPQDLPSLYYNPRPETVRRASPSPSRRATQPVNPRDLPSLYNYPPPEAPVYPAGSLLEVPPRHSALVSNTSISYSAYDRQPPQPPPHQKKPRVSPRSTTLNVASSSQQLREIEEANRRILENQRRLEEEKEEARRTEARKKREETEASRRFEEEEARRAETRRKLDEAEASRRFQEEEAKRAEARRAAEASRRAEEERKRVEEARRVAQLAEEARRAAQVEDEDEDVARFIRDLNQRIRDSRESKNAIGALGGRLKLAKNAENLTIVLRNESRPLVPVS